MCGCVDGERALLGLADTADSSSECHVFCGSHCGPKAAATTLVAGEFIPQWRPRYLWCRVRVCTLSAGHDVADGADSPHDSSTAGRRVNTPESSSATPAPDKLTIARDLGFGDTWRLRQSGTGSGGTTTTVDSTGFGGISSGDSDPGWTIVFDHTDTTGVAVMTAPGVVAMAITTFEPPSMSGSDDSAVEAGLVQFITDVYNGVGQMANVNASQLLLDVSNNGGGFVFLRSVGLGRNRHCTCNHAHTAVHILILAFRSAWMDSCKRELSHSRTHPHPRIS